MPRYYPHGRFCVIDSRASKWNPHLRHSALIELNEPVHETAITWDATTENYVYPKTFPRKIDPRLKCIKRIIMVWDISVRSGRGWWLHKRTIEKAELMCERWDKLYPMHIIAKDWPLPLPVYPEYHSKETEAHV